MDLHVAPGNVLHLLGRGKLEPDHFPFRVKSWRVAQHYVGDLRAINNNVLDTYQLKSQTAIADNYDMNEQTPGSEKYFMRVRQPYFSPV